MMRIYRYLKPGIAGLAMMLLAGCGSGEETDAGDESPEAAGERPNILLIVADDLGYADIGAFGSEIPTPNLDELARNGLILTDFHSGQTCSPTRAMLLSGNDSHRAGLGAMTSPTEEQEGEPGYLGHLNFRVASLAELMSDAGYDTYMTGKWHLGLTQETSPAARGFKRSSAILEGGAGHLDGLSFRGPGPAPYREDGVKASLPDDFYSSRFFARRMIDYIDADRGNDKPFFAYLAFTAPHWPLQAPAESIARFDGRYDMGYDALYKERMARMKKMGLIPEDAPGVPKREGETDWTELTETEKKISARRMEVYAAMVSDLDTYVGEVIDYLKAEGMFENTFIMFMSDNGAEAGRYEQSPAFKDWVAECCDNSYENMGRARSYITLGAAWARASASPLHEFKISGFEGGHRVPAFVHFPGVVEGGNRSDVFGSVLDLMPTFLALAGTEHPGTTYQGREVYPPQGQSLLPFLTAKEDEVHDPDYVMGWELWDNRAVRKGGWKIVWDPDEDTPRWHLYNVENDISEANDLADERPEKLADMIRYWKEYQAENGVIPYNPD